jgi:hypothetical protein
MLASKASMLTLKWKRGKVLYSGRLEALLTNIRLGLKIMPRADTLTYYEGL